jgi:hypothetical protein
MYYHRILLRSVHGDILVQHVGDSGGRIGVGSGRRIAPARFHVDTLHRGGHVAVAEGYVPHLHTYIWKVNCVCMYVGVIVCACEFPMDPITRPRPLQEILSNSMSWEPSFTEMQSSCMYVCVCMYVYV